MLGRPRELLSEVLNLHCTLGEEPRLDKKGLSGALRSHASR